MVVDGADTQILDRNFARDHGLPIFDGVVIPLEVIAGFGVGPRYGRCLHSRGP